MDWNFNLFLKINKLVGSNKWLDSLGRAGGEIIIFFSFTWFLIASFLKFYPNKQEIFLPIAFLGLTWLVGFAISQVIGMVVKEKRPKAEHPEINELFNPISHWKSFPSDHTLAAFVIFFIALIFSLPFAWILLVLAFWVAWGRVYGGVHYPLDVIGGLLLAGLVGVGAWYVYLLVF